MGAVSRFITRFKIEVAIVAFVFLIGALFAWYVYDIGLTRILIDQNSHLNIARQITDSMTPGINQVGLWPPLLHFIMFPAAAIDVLFQSGLAGAAVLIPILGATAVVLYRLIKLFVPGELLPLFGVGLFVTNPYILYYAVTPMTELLFISMVIGTAYFLALWHKSDNIIHLIYTAMLVVAASLARFEGFILVPVVATLAFLNLRRREKRREEIEAVLVLFGAVALLGIVYTFVYGFTFAGDPLAFMNGVWSASAQQQDYVLPTQYSLASSIEYLFFASVYMLGFYQIVLAAIAVAATLFVITKRKQARPAIIAAAAVLISPAVFDILALVQGSAVLYVPDLPPYESFFNERYGLYWFGLVVFAPLAFAAAILDMETRTRIQQALQSLGMLLGSILLVSLASSNISFLNRVAFEDRFSVLQESAQGFLRPDQQALASALREEYDGGSILITRALQNFVTVEAGIDLKQYIHESNFPYYQQTLERPWLFARWVVMYNPDIQVADWRKHNELVSAQWGNSEDFNLAYELVYENGSERLYRLREEVLYAAAREQGVNADAIPSLNAEVARWNPETVYEDIIENSDITIASAVPTNTTRREKGPVQPVRAREIKEEMSVFFR